jgi:hypothetical protein
LSPVVVLEGDALRVRVNPRVGGTITAIEHKASGLSVLGEVPWDPIDAPLEPPAAADEDSWLTRYGGGWPLLFPNAGDACTFAGRFHGFHGEASVAPWLAKAGAGMLELERRFVTVPVQMRRQISLDGDLLILRETATVVGQQPVTVMWGHHPTFGSDLLDGDFEIQSGAGIISVDAGYDPPTNPLQAGATGRWPLAPGRAGIVDLRRPGQGGAEVGMAALAFLRDFESPWISIRRLDDAVAVVLSWDASVFPYAWLWCELGGTPGAPWHGRGRLIGLEPNTTSSAAGIADAARRGAPLLPLEPGVPVTATVRLQVFKPAGAVSAIDADGRAR